jgi:hypothetical protein
VGFSLLLATTAIAGTPEQNCQQERLRAWSKFERCVQNVLAKYYGAYLPDEFYDFPKRFWKCRRSYFGTWTRFQNRTSLAGSSCVGTRFTDNGDGTVTDHLTMRVWEKKTNDGSIHQRTDTYQWSANATLRENGSAFASFLATMNGSAFAGSSGWRLPTLPELQSVVADTPCYQCLCPGSSCIAFDDSQTQAYYYWTATELTPDPTDAWVVDFSGVGLSFFYFKGGGGIYVRAVRGGQ